MTAQEYIQYRLSTLPTPSSDAPLKGTQEEIIKAKLLSKRFRKLSATQACLDVIEWAVPDAVEHNTPINISLLFGGNKLWRFDEAPEIDWAELFALMYYVDWAKTIAAVHKPGVVISYYSQDVSVESLNGVPRSETNHYSETFRAMIKWLKPYLPEGVSVEYKRQLEEYENPDDYYTELEEGKQAILAENGGKLPTLTDAMKTATELNVQLKPGQADDPQWRERVELEHQAIFRTKTLSRLFANRQRISICPTNYEGSNSIITGSTKRSLAKFWAGVGALQPHDGKYAELVLTPKQLETAQFDWEPVHFDGLEGKNFSRIRVLK